jgi:hypothetical protein
MEKFKDLKKSEDGKIYARFGNQKKYRLVADNEIATYLVYLVATSKTESALCGGSKTSNL